MGIQRHSDAGPRLICEWIWAGIIGEVYEVDAWCSLSYYPAGHASWSPKWLRHPADTPKMPADLNWDVWIGPAPMRPYHPAYHPRSWRAWWDFGSGMMGDRGVHTLDSVMWALKLRHPDSIEANSLGLNPDTHPIASIVTFRFPARKEMPALKLTWYDGLTPPRPPELEDGRQFGGNEGGILFKGTKGSIMCNYVAESPRIIPESKMREKQSQLPAPSIPRIEVSHQQNWIRACKGLEKPSSDFQYGARLTEMCILGNIARRANTIIRWDPDNMTVTNMEEPNQWIKKSYRQGWAI
jgi:predicted dehydrogenase